MHRLTRRSLLAASAAAQVTGANTEKPAALGGTPVRNAPFPSWPVFDETEERAVSGVLKSGRWGRGGGSAVETFEREWAKQLGAKACLATSSGTTALLTTLRAMGVQAGDEVILSPYTFVACPNAILAMHALPVFADTDVETFQIDPARMEERITDRTVAIMPVHLGGATFDVDRVLDLARRRKLMVIEDSCQSHFAEWKGRRTGAFGLGGCFSFQGSKNLNSGEGGAIASNDEQFIERCYTYHNNSRSRRQAGVDFTYQAPGSNYRLTEFQGALLSAQLTRLDRQARTRETNAQYLSEALRKIPGIAPARMYAGTTRNAYHLYMFRYDSVAFSGLPRAGFLKALRAERISASSGYTPLNQEPLLKNTFAERGFQRLFSKQRLARWEEQNRLAGNDRLCTEAVWLTQNMLLGPRADMDHIIEAIARIQKHAGEVPRT